MMLASFWRFGFLWIEPEGWVIIKKRMRRFIWGRRSLPRIFWVIVLGILYLPVAEASPVPVDRSTASGASIRVRLIEATPEIRVRGLDLRIYKANPEKNLKADLASEWLFRCVRGAVHARQVSGKGDLARATILGDRAVIRTPAGFLTLNGKPYREELRIYAGKGGCEVVNHLDLEKYLDGLVNAEFNAKWSEEAIAAQVVAARTYAVFQMNAFRSRHFDVESTVIDQVYDGSAIEDFRASRAVEKSRGLILTVPSRAPAKAGAPQKPEILKAFYHSTCGGSTELPQKVWGKPQSGFKRAVSCRYCQSSPKFRWQVTMSSKELVSAMISGLRTRGLPPEWPGDALEWMTRGNLIGLAADRVNGQGRVEQVTSVWSKGGRTLKLSLTGARFRSWVGTSQIQSASFRAVPVQGTRELKWVFEGRGFGHGVGMCQWGAKVMGEKGYSMAQILKHYYPDAVLRKM